MAEGQNRIEIPIEISPQDTRELNQLLERIERAENQLYKLNQAPETMQGGGGPVDISNPMSEASSQPSRRTKKKFDTEELAEGRSPIQTITEEEEEGGIGALQTGAFIGALGRKTLPENFKFKDTASRSPFQRNKPFQDLVDRQNELEKKFESSGLNEITGGIGTLSTLIKNPITAILPIIEEAAPIIGPILIAKGLMDLIIAELLKDGGPFDRRFKIKLESQVVKTLDRQRLRDIRSALADVRVTVGRSLRGSVGNLGTNLIAYKRGGGVYSENLENYSKGGMQ